MASRSTDQEPRISGYRLILIVKYRARNFRAQVLIVISQSSLEGVPEQREYHTPAFMLEDGPIIAPDLRIEHRGKVSFVEAKVRPHASLALLDNAYHRTPVIGWRGQYTASYKRIAKLKINIRLELLLYFCTPGRAQWRPRYASPKWGVFRFSKAVLANGWNRSPFESTEADFLRLSAGARLDQYSMDITRRAVNEMHLAGIDPFERRTGSDYFEGAT